MKYNVLQINHGADVHQLKDELNYLIMIIHNELRAKGEFLIANHVTKD